MGRLKQLKIKEVNIMSKIDGLILMVVGVLIGYYLFVIKQVRKWIEVFSDHFEAINHSNWSIADYPTESTDYVDGNVKTDNYTLLLLETNAQRQGAEVISIDQYTYGRYKSRVKFPDAPNVMGSFYLYSRHDDTTGSDEIDIESIPANHNLVDFVIWKDSGMVKRVRRALPFDISADFHEYIIEWTKDHIIFSIDGIEYYRYADKTKMPSKPCRILFNCRNPSWLGEFVTPGVCEVDYVYVYNLK